MIEMTALECLDSNLVRVPISAIEREHGMRLHLRRSGLPPDDSGERCPKCYSLLRAKWGKKSNRKYCGVCKPKKDE